MTSICASDIHLNTYPYEFFKSYLYALSAGLCEQDGMKVHPCIARSAMSERPVLPTLVNGESLHAPLVQNDVLETLVEWEQGVYSVVVARESAMPDERVHHSYSVGLNDAATRAKELLEIILKRSMAHSPYRNQVLRVSKAEHSDTLQVRTVDIKGLPLASVYLCDESRSAIELFVDAVRDFSRCRTPLRYLLNGRPGTGKTETVRAVMEACRGKATFVFAEAGLDPTTAFDLAACFDPGIVCLDDVDLLYGDRRFHKGGLRDFLDLMDGFAPLPVFVLATTNDKTLVDHAASRPGRFDMILEVDELDNRYLAALVAGRCRFPEVACLFDEDVLETLMRNKASGAFIVNIIKNLELRYELSGEKIGKVDVMNVINGLHKGFYRDSRQSIGFSQED